MCKFWCIHGFIDGDKMGSLCHAVANYPNWVVVTEHTTNPSATKFSQWLEILHQELKTELEHFNEYISRYYDNHHLPALELKPGDKVWLICRNIKTFPIRQTQLQDRSLWSHQKMWKIIIFTQTTTIVKMSTPHLPYIITQTIHQFYHYPWSHCWPMLI